VQVECIVAKTVMRTNAIPLAVWNKNWHDHGQEIPPGRVQVLDLAADQAKAVADLVATADGIILDLWPHGAPLPDGTVGSGQSVGHVNITAAERFQHPHPGH
jgi:hypothetical protein